MLFCVILVWPTKFENSLYFMQNVLEAWEFKENWLNILILGKLGSKQVFFKKQVISYLCILFTKFNALRSFYNILLCFSKIFFPENFGLALCISIDWNSGKNSFLKIKAKYCRNSSKHWILWIKCMSMRWNAFQKHLFWTQF